MGTLITEVHNKNWYVLVEDCSNAKLDTHFNAEHVYF